MTAKKFKAGFILLALFLFFANASFAQDVIVKKDGSTILSKVIEVGSTEVKYKKWSNQGGPTYAILISDILSINYQNGEKETFEQPKAEEVAQPAIVPAQTIQEHQTINGVPIVNAATQQVERDAVDSWIGGMFAITYSSLFDAAGDGAVGVCYHGLRMGGSPIGMTIGWSNIYNLGTKEWLSSLNYYVGANFSYPLSENILLFAPLCFSMNSYDYKTYDSNGKLKTESRTDLGAVFVPTLAAKFGGLVLSAGWSLGYSFAEGIEKPLSANSFQLSLGFFF